jgi:hypothetical protein
MDKKVVEYIEGVDLKMWSKHTFRTTSCSDILLNNIAESFDAWMLEARGQPILTCFETIQRQIMNWFSQENDGAAMTPNIICPKIVKKL